MSVYHDAIQLEQEGAAYYKKQAERFPDSAISRSFKVLAEAERRHEIAIREHLERKGAPLPDETPALKHTFFATVGDVDSDIYLVPRALDVYLAALEMEKKSIDMYLEQLAKAEDEDDKELLVWLISEEEKHYKQLETLANMIRHGDEYVTHAMFANMPEY